MFEHIKDILKRKEFAYRTENGKKIFMHDEIMKAMLGGEIPEGMEVYHLNGNGLDNQRKNLALREIDLKEATLHERPNCDFCGLAASYDAKCKNEAWGYLCATCFVNQKCELGLGKGQRLIIK